MPETVIAATELRRTFGGHRKPERVALADINLQLEAGKTHGLLGPNGAGKTTLCRIASTVLLPTSGRVRVLGHDVVREAESVRRCIGIVFGGDRGLYGRLTARENLLFWCAMNGVSRRRARIRASELLDRLGLAARADEHVEGFSRGMKQRVHLARGLVGDPAVLLLDEPTVGMDPVSAHEFRRLMSELSAEGKTILLTTHDMAEAQALCDTVTFIDHGRIVGEGTPATLRAMQVRGGTRVRVNDVTTDVAAMIRERFDDVVFEHDAAEQRVDMTVPGSPSSVQPLIGDLIGMGCSSLEIGTPSLEDVYLRLLRNDAHGGRGMDVS